jgi:hypothetical protein
LHTPRLHLHARMHPEKGCQLQPQRLLIGLSHLVIRWQTAQEETTTPNQETLSFSANTRHQYQQRQAQKSSLTTLTPTMLLLQLHPEETAQLLRDL